MPELIDRETTLIFLNTAIKQFGENWLQDKLTKNGLLIAKQIVSKQPTIEAEPVRHAHWVFRDEDRRLLEDGCIPSSMWCSYCNQWSDNDSYGDAYCHNCGARMDEPDLADEIAKEESE